MLSDIQIAQQARLLPITKIAQKAGLHPETIDPYGKYKAKVPLDSMQELNNKKNGKLILVTAMNPTPAGEGKTTVSIGLAQALNRIGKNAILALREPSLGPVFGIKGGAAGGGYSQVLPMEDINLHFTGDLHAITAANNLLSATLDNHLFHGNALQIDKNRILWKRCLDMNDRALRAVVVGAGDTFTGVQRDEVFSITAASEVMAIFCMATDMNDLKARLARIAIAYNVDGGLVTAGDLNVHGAMAALLKDALAPNLVQTIEGTPALIHGGPFANISHGCNSVIATKMSLKLADITVTEAGFGADLGAEKFMNLKCRAAQLWPDAVVLVATIRSLKYNANVPKENLSTSNPDALKEGFSNLEKHIENIASFGVPCFIACNKFASDTQEEIDLLKKLCIENGAQFSIVDIYAKGGEGGIELAQLLDDSFEQSREKRPQFTYPLDSSTEDKIRTVAQDVYGAKDIELLPEAKEKIEAFEKLGYGHLPVCIAKTQYALSDNPKELGRPTDFVLTVRDIWLSSGAGYLVVLTGKVLTMPGLPKKPAAESIDIDESGRITGLF